MTGMTFTTGTTLSSSLSMVGGLLISNPSSGEELIRFGSDGEIYYRYQNETIKVNCPDDIAEAFFWTVFGYTGKEPEDVIIDKYIEKISNNERSNEYLSKIERIIRTNKLKKLKF